MRLSLGDILGPYEILAPIGAGGMGEVYKAHDSRLGRDVAIKVSQERFSDRFEREARAVAALNHPNICTLHDVGPNYLVMELIEGESPKGPLPLETALDYARQIASALDAAHSKGIVHRDLKPANIKIKPDGTVKVLDFGLAKTADAPTGDPETAPTLTLSPTRAGMIIGTPEYMSPEQARGQEVDRRADIWAFGVLLCEMLTGQKLFRRDTLSETMASVIRDEPNLEPVPAKVRRLVRRCLEKDPRKRLRDISDAWDLLNEPEIREPSAQRSTTWMAAAGAMAAIAAVAFVLATGLWPIDVPQVERVVPLTNDTTLKGIGRLISDGNRVLYGDDEGADIWSVPVSGGEPRKLSLPFLRGHKVLADYSPIRQQVLLASVLTGSSGGNELFLAGTDGEAPRKIAELNPLFRPALAPDAERIAISTPDGIYVQAIKNGERKRIHPMTQMGGTLPWWHPSGHSVGFQDPPNDQQAARAWQVNDDGTHLRRIVPDSEHGQGLGVWSGDGKRFFYLSEGEVVLRIQAGILGWLRKSVVIR